MGAKVASFVMISISPPDLSQSHLHKNASFAPKLDKSDEITHEVNTARLTLFFWAKFCLSPTEIELNRAPSCAVANGQFRQVTLIFLLSFCIQTRLEMSQRRGENRLRPTSDASPRTRFRAISTAESQQKREYDISRMRQHARLGLSGNRRKICYAHGSKLSNARGLEHL
jgi:hypothetical protein